MKDFDIMRIIVVQAYAYAHELNGNPMKRNWKGGWSNSDGSDALRRRIWNPRIGDLVAEKSSIHLISKKGKCPKRTERSLGYLKKIENSGESEYNRKYIIKTLNGDLITWEGSSFVKVMESPWIREDEYDHEFCDSYRTACEHCLKRLNEWMVETGVLDYSKIKMGKDCKTDEEMIESFSHYHWGKSEEDQNRLWKEFSENKNKRKQ